MPVIPASGVRIPPLSASLTVPSKGTMARVNFREPRACELRRIPLPRTPVNSSRIA